MRTCFFIERICIYRFMEETEVKLSREELKGLMKISSCRRDYMPMTLKLQQRFLLLGLKERGHYSHGAVRVEYYSERIAKGGITVEPNMTWKETGPCSGILDGDNGIGFYCC